MPASLGSFSPHTWLRFCREVPPRVDRASIHMKNVAHGLLYIQRGSASGRWICRGKAFPCDGEAGFVRFHPANGEEHTSIGSVGSQGLRFASLLIPAADIDLLATADEVGGVPELRRIAWPNDAIIRRCLDVLVRSACPDAPGEDDLVKAARLLVLRIVELMGAKMPAWYTVESKFSRRRLRDVVSYIDAHLQVAPSASDMAVACGLSTSHFCKKFRKSVSMGLRDFIGHRRVQASFTLLNDTSRTMADIALEFGFASQSHCTRVFSELTGMTPAKVRRMCGRVSA